jgi:hypothetical protein
MNEQSFSSVHCVHFVNVRCECVRLMFRKTVKRVSSLTWWTALFLGHKISLLT